MSCTQRFFFYLTFSRGTEIWRIENFQPVLVPKSEHGKFYSGDSYIVLQVNMVFDVIFLLSFYIFNLWSYIFLYLARMWNLNLNYVVRIVICIMTNKLFSWMPIHICLGLLVFSPGI